MFQVGVIFLVCLMAIVGQPRRNSEYIQSSGCRKEIRQTRACGFYSQRNIPSDQSHYEQFRSFHQEFYRHGFHKRNSIHTPSVGQRFCNSIDASPSNGFGCSRLKRVRPNSGGTGFWTMQDLALIQQRCAGPVKRTRGRQHRIDTGCDQHHSRRVGPIKASGSDI